MAHAAGSLRARQTAYWWFRWPMWRFLFTALHNVALMRDRERCGASPAAGVLGSQTAKSAHAPDGGAYDAAKRIKGRKPHIAVDTDGRLLMVNLTGAGVRDAVGAEHIVKAIRKHRRWLKPLFTDGAYHRSEPRCASSFRLNATINDSNLSARTYKLWWPLGVVTVATGCDIRVCVRFIPRERNARQR
jgi:hypothetical protein